MLLGMWCSTGTLSIYAATLDRPVVQVGPNCGYLVNIDHPHHRAPFLMLQGAPRETWEFSVVLRRLLYPLLAFPFVSAFGFDRGGLICNVLLQIAAWVGFVAYLRAKFGASAANAGGWLLATYPGITYWIGSPYSYAIIVPASLGAFIVLLHLADEQGLGRAFFLALAAGVLFTGYDLLAFFAPTAVIAVTWKRRLHLLAPILLGFAAPAVLVQLVLQYVYRVPGGNTNTDVYASILHSYLHPANTRTWFALLGDVPKIFAWDFLFANFVFLPVLFLATWLSARLTGGPRLGIVERAMLGATLLVFLLNNLAPPYTGWQMRGTWIARLYQPVFVVFLYYCARIAQWRLAETPGVQRLTGGLLAATVVANALIVFGPVLPIRTLSWLSDRVYNAFYVHSPAGSLLANIEKHGRRPVGFCRSLREPNAKP